MEIREMTVEALEERRTAIRAELEAPEADLDALEAEARAINEELEARKNAENKRAEIRKAVAAGEGTVTKDIHKEERKPMTAEEIRNSAEYIDAYANYIKTGDDRECRAMLLLTELAGGSVPVPSIVEDTVRTAWSRLGLLDLVRKTSIRGILRVPFELSATGADIHEEAGEAPSPEDLVLGVVQLTPANVKKYLMVTDETLDLTGPEFLSYIYEELAYRIAVKVQEELLGLISTAGTTATSTAVGVAEISGAPSLGIIAEAIGELSDKAVNPVAVMNKGTWALFKAAQYDANFAADPFEGLTVYFDNSLDKYDASNEGETWLIVGDFGVGAQANFPRGEEIIIKQDELSYAQADLVKFVAREYVALGLVGDKAFTRVTVPTT